MRLHIDTLCARVGVAREDWEEVYEAILDPLAADENGPNYAREGDEVEIDPALFKDLLHSPQQFLRHWFAVANAHSAAMRRVAARFQAAGERFGRLHEKRLAGETLTDAEVAEGARLAAELAANRRIEIVAEPGARLLFPEDPLEFAWWGEEVSRRTARRRVEGEAERERRRAEKVAARPAPAVVEARRCSRCKRRPPRFDDYCGRCADELGLRPKGKIGSSG